MSTQLTSPWADVDPSRPKRDQAVDLRSLITMLRRRDVEMKPTLPVLRHGPTTSTIDECPGFIRPLLGDAGWSVTWRVSRQASLLSLCSRQV